MNINWISERFAVGSSDWLGLFVVCLVSYRYGCSFGCELSGLLVIGQCVRILVEEYREAKQRRREYEQYCRKHDQATTVLVSGKTDDSKNASKLVESAHCELRVKGWILRARDKLLHFVEKLLRALLEVVLRLRAHRPNETEISHGRVSWQARWTHFEAGTLASSTG
jgi:hypothetical protein